MATPLRARTSYDLKTQRNEDPIQALESLADALVQKGVKFIDGDIVATILILLSNATAKAGARTTSFGPTARRLCFDH